MSKKNVYFYELVIEDAQTGSAIPVDQYRGTQLFLWHVDCTLLWLEYKQFLSGSGYIAG